MIEHNFVNQLLMSSDMFLEQFEDTQQIIRSYNGNQNRHVKTESLHRQFLQISKKFKQFEADNHYKLEKIRKRIPKSHNTVNLQINEEIMNFKTKLSDMDVAKKNKPKNNNPIRYSLDVNYKSDGLRRNGSSPQKLNSAASHSEHRTQKVITQELKANIQSQLIQFEEGTYNIFRNLLNKIVTLQRKVQSLQSKASQAKQLHNLKNTKQIYQIRQNNVEYQRTAEKQAKLQGFLLEKQLQLKNNKAQLSLIEQKYKNQIKKNKESEQKFDAIIKELNQDNLKQFNNMRKHQDNQAILTKKLEILQQQYKLFQNNLNLNTETETAVNQELKKAQDKAKQLEYTIQEMTIQQEQNYRKINHLTQKISQFQHEIKQYELAQQKLKQMLNQQIEESKEQSKLYHEESIDNQNKIKRIEQKMNTNQSEIQKNINNFIEKLKFLSSRHTLNKSSKKQQRRIQESVSQSQQSQRDGISAVFYQIGVLQNILDEWKLYQKRVKKSLVDNFSVSNIEYEVKGFEVVIENIKNDSQIKNKKIHQLQESCFALQKQFTKKQIQKKIASDKQTVYDQKERNKEIQQRMTQSLKNPTTPPKQIKQRSRQKQKQLNLEKRFSENNCLIQNLKKKVEQKQYEELSNKYKYQTQKETLQIEINLLKKDIKDISQQFENSEDEKQRLKQEVKSLREKIKQLKILIEEGKKDLKNKDIENLKENKDNLNKIKSLQKNILRSQKQLEYQKTQNIETHKKFEELMSNKEKMIDELLKNKAKTTAENRILNEKLNRKIVNEDQQKQLKQNLKSLFIVHPRSMRICIKNQTSSKSIKQLEQQLENSEDKNIQLEIEKRKFVRQIAELQKKLKQSVSPLKSLQQNQVQLQKVKQELEKEKQFRQNLEIRLKYVQNQKKRNHQNKIMEYQREITLLKETEENLNQQLKQKNVRENQLIKTLQRIEESRQDEISKLQSNYLGMLDNKQQELKMYIEKYNNAKIQLIDQLDGKSDCLHAAHFQHENHIILLKEQIEILERQLKQKNSAKQIKSSTYLKSEKNSRIKPNTADVNLGGNSRLDQQKISYQQNQQNLNEQIEDNQQLYDEEYQDQLADEVGDLDFYSPLEKRIIIEEQVNQKQLKMKPAFSLGLLEMMGDQDSDNQEVLSPVQY